MVILRTNSGRKIIVEGSLQQVKDQVFNALGGYLYPLTDENKLNDQTMFDSPMFGTHTGERDAINPSEIEEYIETAEPQTTQNENQETSNAKQSKNRK